MRNRLFEIYQRLYDHFGPQRWWPGETPYEVMIGAVLTQNTNWKNVEKAIDNLKGAGALSYAMMASMPTGLLAEYIRPAGYYNIKANRLHNLLALIRERYDGSMERVLAEETGKLRQALLSVRGIGPETADSILLYAAQRPVFVVDAYTHRILSRHDLIGEDVTYDDLQHLFMDNLEPDTTLCNEYHALLVCTAKNYCRKTNPRCSVCPLQGV